MSESSVAPVSTSLSSSLIEAYLYLIHQHHWYDIVIINTIQRCSYNNDFICIFVYLIAYFRRQRYSWYLPWWVWKKVQYWIVWDTRSQATTFLLYFLSLGKFQWYSLKFPSDSIALSNIFLLQENSGSLHVCCPIILLLSTDNSQCGDGKLSQERML